MLVNDSNFDPVSHLEKSIRRQGKVLSIVGLVMALATLGPLSVMLITGKGLTVGHGDKVGDLYAGIGLLSFFGIIGALLVVLGVRTKPQRDPFYLALRDQPTRIVWIYDQVIKRNGVSHYGVTLNLDNGRSNGYSVPDQEKQIAMRNGFAQRCPNAIVGYSTEREVAYKRAPSSVATV